MGKVYKAFDPKLKRFVALKFVKGDSDVVVKRFVQEAQSQGQLVHENICRIYEVGEYNQTPYIAMQYISGGNLAENSQLGDGPGHYALGWGYLAIQDYEHAKIHFYKS